MENSEEVMQLLEEFSKVKPKEIPRELDDYLGYVAKTGDPVFQWSLVKHLFREKLLSVITDFYESTLTVDLPPCPNVDPFNYERMKTSLLERFDTFSSAPFTVQRICELLTNPRKEYNRADKYMRAIEKNILVVSTREPGMGKRPLECDNPPDTVLNGIPDVKPNESGGNLLHVPSDVPYLGAPPASNDVTVETTEPNSTISNRVSVDMNDESNKLKTSSDKPWPTLVSVPALAQDIQQPSTTLHTGTPSTDVSLSVEERDCDTINRLTNTENINPNVRTEHFDGEGSSDMFIQSNDTVLTDSIDSTNLTQENGPIGILNSKLEEPEENESVNDENEVSSTPADDIPLIQEESEDPTDSEAEATETSLIQDVEPGSVPDCEINSRDNSIQSDQTTSVTICEVAVTKKDEIALECNEITGTGDSPVSPINTSVNDDVAGQNINLGISEECEQPDLHPDSSNDVCLQTKTVVCVESQTIESCAEADSMSERNVVISELEKKNDFLEGAPNQPTDEILIGNNTQISSPGLSKVPEEEQLQKIVEDKNHSCTSAEDVHSGGGGGSGLVSVAESCLNPLTEDIIKLGDNLKYSDAQSTGEVSESICDQDRRESSVIQSASTIIPDRQQQTTVEEINVDQSCEAEEEAMDIDDSSNQMMVSEGENEGEPMDQSDQLQS